MPVNVPFLPDTGSGGQPGLVPAPATGDSTKFLSGSGVFAIAPGSTLAVKGATYTITTPAVDGGAVIQSLTDGHVSTLPASVAANKGMRITLQNTATAGAAGVQFTRAGADTIIGTIVGVTVTANTTLTNTKATAKKGDHATLVSDGAGVWWIIGGVGVWA